MAMYNYNESYDDLRERLKEERNGIMERKLGFEDPSLKQFTKDFEKLTELLLFSLVREQDNFYALVILQMNRKVDYTLPAPAAVNYQGTYFNLYINPLMMLEFNLSEMKAVLIHECFHVFNEHLPRSKKYIEKVPHTIVNIGLDCSINQYIDKLPDGCVTIESLNNQWGVKQEIEPKREAEYYVSLLMEEYKNNEDFKDQIDEHEKQRSGNGGEQGSGSGSGGGDQEGGMQSSEGKGSMHDKWQESDDEGQDYANMKDTVKKMLNEAQQKARGTIPGEMIELIKRLNEKPIITWQQLLRKYVGTIPVPYKKTIMRRNRRQPKRTDLRGKLSDREVEIVVGIDTSGSVSDMEISYCINEVFNIVKHTKSTVTIVECDFDVSRVYEAKKPQDVKPDVSGRGGTRFQPVFDWINQNNKKHAVVVFFTDGGGETQLDARPKCHKLLWVLTRGNEDDMSLMEPYGEIKLLELDKKFKNMLNN